MMAIRGPKAFCKKIPPTISRIIPSSTSTLDSYLGKLPINNFLYSQIILVRKNGYPAEDSTTKIALPFNCQ